jgi:regulatory protein
MAHTITALSVQRRNPQRVNLYLDGEFAFGLARIVAAWLEVGQVLSDEKIAQLQTEDTQEVAYLRALNLLSYRPRSTAEIRQNLRRHGADEACMQQVIERLERSGLVNDTEFARLWVENRSEFRPRSQRALSYELRQRGVAAQDIEEALQPLDNQELACQAALKQARKLKDLEWQDFRKKMYAFLARRGFSYQDSSVALSRAWTEYHENEIDPSGLEEVNQ